MKRAKLILSIITGVLLLSFIITLFNQFRDDDVRYWRAVNYFNIQIEEREDSNDEDYLYIRIENISGNDVYDTSIIFGNRLNNYAEDNYIWFRKAKIDKDDIITIKLFENSSMIRVNSKYTLENYEVSVSPKIPNLDLDRCMTIDTLGVDSEEPKIIKIHPAYWTMEKLLFASLTVISGLSLVALYFIEKKQKGYEKGNK